MINQRHTQRTGGLSHCFKVDYKIGSSYIANRLKKVFPSLINEGQTGFMSNRSMGDNKNFFIRLIYDLIHYLNCNTLSGLLIFIDFEKAFD